MERLILDNPVYPRPSEIVINIQKMFKKSRVWIGPTATSDRLTNTKESSQEIAVLAAPLAVNDKLDAESPPTFFFSPDKNGRRTFDARTLFSIPFECQLLVLPVAWFEVKDAESISGDGPLLLSSAAFYSGSRMYMVNYSDPDWGTDEQFLTSVLKKMSEKTPPGTALAGYTRDISSALKRFFCREAAELGRMDINGGPQLNNGAIADELWDRSRFRQEGQCPSASL